MSNGGDDLHGILLAENAALRACIDVLNKEQELLLKGETDQLGVFSEAKAQLVLNLTRLGEQRLQWLANRGVKPTRAGMEGFLNARYSDDKPEVAEWLKLLTLATTANQLNVSNGIIISTRLKSTQRALHTLFSSARLPAAYASDGSTVGYRTANQIATA